MKALWVDSLLGDNSYRDVLFSQALNHVFSSCVN